MKILTLGAIWSSLLVPLFVSTAGFAANAQTPTLHARLARSLPSHNAPGRDVAFSPDSKILASAGVDSVVRLWSVPDGKLIGTLRHPIGVTVIAFAPDGRSLVTGSYDAIIRVWRLDDRTVVKTLTGHNGTIWGLDVSSDGQLIASSGEDKTAKIWRMSDGSLLRTLTGHSLNIWKAVFTPDSRYLATGSFDETARIWRVSDGQLIRILRGHTEAVVGLDVSGDGNTIATSGDDSSVRLWRLSDGRLLRILTGGSQHIYAVSFSGDSRWLASGGREKNAFMTFWKQITGNRVKGGNSPTIRLWRVSDGALQQRLADNDDDVVSVAISPDGNWLSATSSDGGVKLWSLSVRQ
jgi:WD40 repeat protein